MLPEFLRFAENTAREAGALTLEYFLTDGARPEFKADDTPVTVADRGAEELIRRRIAESYPDHEIVGEEFGASSGNSEYRWFIDPIDGTKSFTHGVPLYAVLLALEIRGKVEVGCAYFPALNEMVSAATGHGALWNGRPCHVSEVSGLDRAVCAHIDTAYFGKNGKGAPWERLQKAVYYNAGWCDAYGYLLVATGRAEIMLDPVMAVWDCGPFPPILKEAGGYFGDWAGNEGRIDGGEALATNAALRDEVVALLKG
ncbi:MAG: inositol monophosphatase family protein [Verrucomicrobiales bacterium]